MNVKLRNRGLLTLLAILGWVLLHVAPASAASPYYKIGYANWTTNYLTSPDGTNNVFVSSAGLGRWDWTPDGEKYVYTGSGRQVYLRNQDGGEFPIGTIEADDVELSPDGTKIAYVPEGEDYINIADVQGNHIGTLGEGDEPTWSPDGKRIAYSKSVSQDVQCGAPASDPPKTVTLNGKALFVGSASGGEGSMVNSEPFVEIADNVWQWAGGTPDWSPDDTAIVVEGQAKKVSYSTSTSPYRCVQSDYLNINYDVFKISPAGGEPQNLTAGAEWVGTGYPGEPSDLNPSFSPDGQTIAFASSRDSSEQLNIHSLWKMNANGSSPTLVRPEYRVDETDWMTALPVGHVVRIKAPDNCATEENTTPGTFTLERTGPTDGNLPVQVRVASTSTATSGSDFEPIATTVTIPDGTDTAAVHVWPLDDSQSEPDEKIVVEIVSASGGLLVGEPSIATITIADDDGGEAGPCAATSNDPVPPRDEEDPADPSDPTGPSADCKSAMADEKKAKRKAKKAAKKYKKAKKKGKGGKKLKKLKSKAKKAKKKQKQAKSDAKAACA